MRSQAMREPSQAIASHRRVLNMFKNFRIAGCDIEIIAIDFQWSEELDDILLQMWRGREALYNISLTAYN